MGVTLQGNTPKPELIVVPEGGQLSWRLSQKCRTFYVSHKRNCTNGKWQAWNGSGSGRFQGDIPDIRLRTFIKIFHDDQCTGPLTITGCLHKAHIICLVNISSRSRLKYNKSIRTLILRLIQKVDGLECVQRDWFCLLCRTCALKCAKYSIQKVILDV